MATIAEPNRPYTPEDLLGIDGGAAYELIDGHLVEPDVSYLSELVGSRLLSRLDAHAERLGIGFVSGSGTMLRCFAAHPGRIRRPDVCFVRRDRLDASQLDAGFLTVAPDLVVEVVSPNDVAEDLEAKLLDYLDAGIPLIWVIYPVARSAVVHRGDGSARRLRAPDELDGEGVLPGFSCRLADLFPVLPAPAAPASEPASG